MIIVATLWHDTQAPTGLRAWYAHPHLFWLPPAVALGPRAGWPLLPQTGGGGGLPWAPGAGPGEKAGGSPHPRGGGGGGLQWHREGTPDKKVPPRTQNPGLGAERQPAVDGDTVKFSRFPGRENPSTTQLNMFLVQPPTYIEVGIAGGTRGSRRY